MMKQCQYQVQVTVIGRENDIEVNSLTVKEDLLYCHVHHCLW